MLWPWGGRVYKYPGCIATAKAKKVIERSRNVHFGYAQGSVTGSVLTTLATAINHRYWSTRPYKIWIITSKI